MATKLNILLSDLERWARPDLAADWDAIGISVGGGNPLVERLMLALTPSLAVIEQAISQECQLLVAHHPFLFRAIKRIDPATAQGKAIQLALRHDLTIYGIHTNLDATRPGVSDILAERLGLGQLQVLAPSHSEALVKLATFAPSSHVPALIEALSEAGAGQIGDYSRCSFRTAGTGTFLPGDRARPFVGTPGRLAEEAEERLEMRLPATRLTAALEALLRTHPYEEVAYDVYPLTNSGESFGIGRIGDLEAPISLSELSERIRTALQADGLRVLGDPARLIQRVAVAGGSCGDMWDKAVQAGADAFVTGDIRYHDALDAHEAGLAMLDAGHWATEWPSLDLLENRLRALDPQLTIVRSQERVPF